MTTIHLRKTSAVSLLAVILVLAGVLHAKELSVTVESAAPRPAAPATFGVIFAKGDVKDAVEAAGMPTQCDIKRCWPDGSVKHAVLTVQLPEMGKAPSRLALVPARAARTAADNKPPDYRGDLKDLADVRVEFQIHNGPVESVSLRKTVASTQPIRTAWLSGPLVREWHFRATPADEAGKGDPELEVRFQVRYYPTAKVARVAVIVENCHWTSAGAIPYDVKVLVDGKEAYAKKEAGRFEADGNNNRLKVPEEYGGHVSGARWIMRFWVPAGGGNARPLDDAHVRYDLAYWNTTGLLPKYDPALVVPEDALQLTIKRWQLSAHDILQNGLILPYFPATGGREDLGPLPAWATRYVISQDPRLLPIILGNGDMSGTCQVHWRDPKTDWAISIDEHPKFSLNPPGSLEHIKPRDAAQTPWVLPSQPRISIDSAHQPSLAYVPYLLTGDFFYLEEIQFWADWNMLINNYAWRLQDKGILTCNGLQPRGAAWSLRQLTHAAAITPDSGSEAAHKDYFEKKLANNLAYYRDMVEGKTDPKPTAIGILPIATVSAYGKTPEIRDKYRTLPGWMHNFIAWSFIHAAEQGYSDAVPVRDYMCKLAIGAFTHPDEISPAAGTAYYIAAGEKGDDGKVRFYETWKQVKEGMDKMGAPVQDKVSYPDYGSSYSYIARAVLIEAKRAKLQGAADALKWLDGQLPDRQKVMGADPTWGFAPAE